MARDQEMIAAVQAGAVEKVRELLDQERGLAAARDGAGVSAIMHALYRQGGQERDPLVEGRRVHCVVHGSFEPLMAAVAGAHVVNLSSHEPSLEDTFLEYYSGAGKEPVGASC